MGILSDFAANGEAAIKMIKEKQKDKSCQCYYKNIILDCNMPIKDGYETCKELKELIN